MRKRINKYKYHLKKVNIDEIIEKRYKVLVVIIILMISILFLKLFYLQIIEHEKYKEKLEVLTKKIVEGDTAPRGRIYDRNGNILVDNKSVKTIYYKKPSNVTASSQIKLAYKIAEYIDVDYSKLTDNMLKRFWILNNVEESKKRIKEKEWKKLKLRKITNDDIEQLKLERVTEEDLSAYGDLDKEACYIYNLMNKGYYYTEKIIKNKDVTDAEYAKVAENINSLPGFNVKLAWERIYPYENVFKTMLGVVSSSSTGVPYNLKEYYLKKGYNLSDRVGTSYIELQYEKYLKGENAKYQINNDGSYTEISKGKRGNDIVLSIDINLQIAVEKIIEEELLYAKSEPNTQYLDKAYVVINNPKTGEILAMASKQVVRLDDGSLSIIDYTPGVITSSVTPGSIVKGASHTVGYNTGALSIGEVRNDACIKIAATPLKCSYTEYGNIDDIQALKYSSNTYQFHTAMKVGGGNYVYDGALVIDKGAFDTYRNIFAEYGLGIKTKIDLPNESLGYKGKSRLSGLLLDFSIGQYDTYTPIQISQYMSTIANDGVRIQPHLLKAVFKSSDEPLSEVITEFKTKELNKVNIESKYLDRIKEGFKQVLEPGGTGYGYINPAYMPAGKTGTAQSFIDTNGDGVIDTETTTATFSGYAPYDNPEVVFTIISPDISPGTVDYLHASQINHRISQKVAEKYFEIYR